MTPIESMPIEALLALIDAHIKAHPTEPALEAWRDLRCHIAALNDQRWLYFGIGMAAGITLVLVVILIGGSHP